MTFEEFVASRVRLDDIGEISGAETSDPIPGYVYAPTYEGDKIVGGFWIVENTRDGQIIGTKPKFSLFIIQSEWDSDDLADLERRLWDEFAEGEMNTQGEEEPVSRD